MGDNTNRRAASGATGRDERLKAALRQNLARRKAQQRLRRAEDGLGGEGQAEEGQGGATRNAGEEGQKT